MSFSVPTASSGNSPDDDLAFVPAENKRLRHDLARTRAHLDQQFRGGGVPHEPDTQIIDGLCNVFEGGTQDNDSMCIKYEPYIKSEPYCDSLMCSKPYCDCSPPRSYHSSQNSLYSSNLNDEFDDEHTSFFSEQEFMESPPGWHAHVGSPRSCELMLTTTDENHDWNAQQYPPVPSKKKQKLASNQRLDMKYPPHLMGFPSVPAITMAASNRSISNNGAKYMSPVVVVAGSSSSVAGYRTPRPPMARPTIPRVSKTFLIESPQPPIRVKMENISLPPPPPPPALVTKAYLRETKKENSWWDVVLTPNQRTKHENWTATKLRRVKYGRKFVYINKRDVAKARVRADGKFQRKQGCKFPTPPKTAIVPKRKRK